MESLLWILAVLSLIGGILLGIAEEEITWAASGLVSFALLGGFAVVITILKEMSNQLYNVKDVLAKIAEEQNTIQKNLVSTNKGQRESIGEKLLEEQRKKEEEEKKRLEEQRRKEEEERKRQEEQRRKEEEEKKRLEEQRKKEEAALWAAAEETRIKKFRTFGEEVVFGKYPQGEDGAEADIAWTVLYTDKKQSLLISKYALDAQKYNQTFIETNWKNSDIRQWLNNKFFEMAFSEKEQKAVCATNLTDEKTEDKVFLLSEADANKFYGYKHYRSCQVTPFAENNGAYCNEVGKGWWWLRTMDKSKTNAKCVNVAGKIESVDVDNTDCSVRPVIWINTDLIGSAAGK